jgi:two-component system, NtrC family, response regulator AtoC
MSVLTGLRMRQEADEPSPVRSLPHLPESPCTTLRDSTRLGPILGRSAAMQPVFDMIQRVAPTDAGVLIHGESGTGKEVVANTLHAMSRRHRGPMVAVNCGAIPESLMESELFGHEKGSFTGADRQHRGYFERADEGTLFLDEITEMPVEMQVKLLRVLEKGCVQRVGGTATIHSDVRILASTNREPHEAIASGKLREDLFFRLAVFPICLPPLREREGDIALLAQHFLDDHNRTHGTAKCWAPDALEALASRPWRGNMRELRNAVQRAFILADKVLYPELATAHVNGNGAAAREEISVTVPVGSSITEMERLLICATLEHVKGNKLRAASILGISLKTLYSRLSVYASAQA